MFRTARWPDPFEFPPPPGPLPQSESPVDGGFRWDDPRGEFSTLYCATTAEAAFGETIARYRVRPGLLQAIDDFLEGSPDPAFDPELRPGEIPADYFDDRVLGRAPLEPSARFVDLGHPDTHVALTAGLAGLLRAHGLPEFDRGVLMSSDRRITREVARHYYDLAQTHDHDELCGLRYESRLVAGWECWGVWPPSPIRLTAAPQPLVVTRNNPDLQAAATRLGVKIPT